MKYCRFCAFCIEADVSFCTLKNQALRNINRNVECRDYKDRSIGEVSSGKSRKKPEPEMDGQMSLFEVFGG